MKEENKKILSRMSLTESNEVQLTTGQGIKTNKKKMTIYNQL